MKNEELKMKNEKCRTFSSAKPMKNENYTDGESKNNSSFYILHSSLTHAFLLASICVLTALFIPTPLRATDKIKSGGTWNDTSGSFINAHGGQVIFVDGYYYWFGETRKTSVSCYRSTDLMNWTRLADALSPSGSMTDDNKDIASGRNLERPKVAYNAQTNKWVMFIHWENGSDYGQAKVAVAQSDKVQGPYTLVDVFRPNDHDSRDQTIFVDDDGTAYHIFSSEDNLTLHISELTKDYTAHTGRYVRVAPSGQNEAPAILKRNGRYWMITSGCTGWAPNKARMFTAKSIWGPWTQMENPCSGKDADITFFGQSTYILKVEGLKDAYIFMADIWRPMHPSDARYIWLPIKFGAAGEPIIPWKDEWSMDEFR